jgi:hypothetical protein
MANRLEPLANKGRCATAVDTPEVVTDARIATCVVELFWFQSNQEVVAGGGVSRRRARASANAFFAPV